MTVPSVISLEARKSVGEACLPASERKIFIFLIFFIDLRGFHNVMKVPGFSDKLNY